MHTGDPSIQSPWVRERECPGCPGVSRTPVKRSRLPTSECECPDADAPLSVRAPLERISRGIVDGRMHHLRG